MHERLIRAHYRERCLPEEEAEIAVRSVREYEAHLARRGITVEESGVDEMKEYLASLVGSGHNSSERLIALARYCALVGKQDVYRYFTSILGVREIVENLAERVETIAGHATRECIFGGLVVPPAGSPPESIPDMTRQMVTSLQQQLPDEQVRAALTGNMHGIPKSTFDEERARFQRAESLDAYLSDYHERMVKVLEQHAADGTLWFEQRITPEVVEFVRSEPEVLGGVRRGRKIYLTKIPYDPDAWLKERNPRKRSYLACHCPLARASLQRRGEEIPSVWCHCSAGYAKLRFDVVFNTDVTAEVLENALEGSDRCRFAVTIPD